MTPRRPASPRSTPGPPLTAPAVARARRHLMRCDPVLAPLVRELGPCPLAKDDGRGAFEALTQAIVSQQLSAKAAATIYGRVVALLPSGAPPQAAEVLAVPEADLRAAGLSTRKAEYVRGLARHVLEGRLPVDHLTEHDDDRVIDELTRVKGIGRWSAEMFLIFRLRRPDVLPVDDVGIQRAVRRAYGLRKHPGPAALTRIAAPWRPYRSVACWYLWASLG